MPPFPIPQVMRRRVRDLHVLHIGKTGGSALKAAIDGVDRVGGGRVICHGHGTALADVPRGQDIVFILRDPVARIVSGFESRKRCGRPRYNVPWSEGEAAAFATFGSASDLGRGLLDPDATRREAAVCAFDAIQHVRDRYWRWFGAPGLLRRRADDIFFIARQERLAQDFDHLKDIAGLPCGLCLPRDGITSHKATTKTPAPSGPALMGLRAAAAQDYGFIRLCEAELGLRPLSPSHPADRRAPAPGPSPRPAVASEA